MSSSTPKDVNNNKDETGEEEEGEESEEEGFEASTSEKAKEIADERQQPAAAPATVPTTALDNHEKTGEPDNHSTTRKYRARDEIFEAYLAPLEHKTLSKTELMRLAKSYQNQYQIYFPKMLDFGLVEYDRSRHLCRLTNKGHKFLELRRAQHKLLCE
jgi:predicted transcriptional regulator